MQNPRNPATRLLARRPEAPRLPPPYFFPSGQVSTPPSPRTSPSSSSSSCAPPDVLPYSFSQLFRRGRTQPELAGANHASALDPAPPRDAIETATSPIHFAVSSHVPPSSPWSEATTGGREWSSPDAGAAVFVKSGDRSAATRWSTTVSLLISFQRLRLVFYFEPV